MKCTFSVPKFLPNKAYYVSDMDYDIKIGGTFQMIIHPFPCSDDDNAAFYYVREGSGNSIIIEGEGYIITNPAQLRRYKAMGRKEYSNKAIWYYWTDKQGNIIKKERK